jgi:protein-S-isoprenylcysteine O-methyltransferase Ste14
MSASRLILQTSFFIVVLAALLFGAAGTIRWPAGWVFIAEMGIISLAMSFWLRRHDPALLKERFASPFQRAQERWDKFFMAATLVIWPAWLVFMALDCQRFHWSHLPFALRVVGAVAIALGMGGAFLAVRENTYLAPVVKIQSERGHKVIDTGPYRFVRHPMYTGALIYHLGMPLLLGSWWGLALEPLLIAGMGWRAVMEERTLAQKLPGYAEYAQRVRWRLIPLIW